MAAKSLKFTQHFVMYVSLVGLVTAELETKCQVPESNAKVVFSIPRERENHSNHQYWI